MKQLLLTFLLVFVAFSADAAEKETVYDRVMRTGILRCGYFIEPPLTQQDLNKGTLEGVVVELTESLTKEMGLKVEWTEEINASTMIEGLNTGRYDALCASIWNITSRSYLMEHSVPYLYTPIGAYVRADDLRFDADYFEVARKAETKIVGIDGDGGFLIAKKSFPDSDYVLLPQFSSHAEMFLNLTANKGDIAFAILPIFKEYIDKNPRTIKNVAKEMPFNVLGNSFAFKKGEIGMKSMFDNAIMTYVNSGELDQIIDRWEKYPNSFYRVSKPYEMVE